MRPQVARIESTPVCGVDNRNEVVADLLAPCLRSDAATGITPHEHSGKGMPKRVALTIEENLPPPRCFSIQTGEIKTDNMPDIRKPRRR
jgi:hypothetical protein